MRIEKLRKAELEAFVMSDAFSQMEYIPISRHRAVSQCRNPRAGIDDVLLLVAYEEEKMLGYLGLLPDNYTAGKESWHFAWMTTIWVHPDARGKGVARKLLDAALDDYDGRITGTDFTEEAKAIYLKTGHFDLLEKFDGVRLYYRFNLSELLPKKRPALRSIKSLLSVTDFVLNALNYLRPKPSSGRSGLDIIEFKNWTSAHDKFIAENGSASPTARGSNDLNWIIQNLWVLQAADAGDLGKRYHFTSAEKRAEFKCVELKKGNVTVALLLLFIKGKSLKVPYAFFDENEIGAVCGFLDDFMHRQKLTMLTVFHPNLSNALRDAKTRSFLKRTVTREYVAGIDFHRQIDGKNLSHFQDGDGDCAFT